MYLVTFHLCCLDYIFKDICPSSQLSTRPDHKDQRSLLYRERKRRGDGTASRDPVYEQTHVWSVLPVTAAPYGAGHVNAFSRCLT